MNPSKKVNFTNKLIRYGDYSWVVTGKFERFGNKVKTTLWSVKGSKTDLFGFDVAMSDLQETLGIWL